MGCGARIPAAYQVWVDSGGNPDPCLNATVWTPDQSSPCTRYGVGGGTFLDSLIDEIHQRAKYPIGYAQNVLQNYRYCSI